MSSKYKDKKEVPTEVLCARLDELSDAVTKGRDSILQNFGMRIPAEVDHDADCVLAEAARRLREMEKDKLRLDSGCILITHCEDEWGYTSTQHNGRNLRRDIDGAIQDNA
jgi:hypothetical protein